MTGIAVGRKVPAFSAEATGGSTISSRSLKGRKYVLYFYPRDNTPGCTVESQDFRDLHDAFRRRKVAVIGVSRDSLKSHDGFKAKFALPFELIADPDETLCNLFGVIKDKNMYGRRVRGIERSTFLVDENGVLVREWRKVRVDGHAQEVLDSLEERR